MNIRKLYIFYETAKCLNMSKVAKEMFISQPSISQCILELESELNVKLFDRIGKKLYLTYEGELFFNYTRRILNLYEESISTINDLNKDNKGRIIVGTSTTIGIYIMPYIIEGFSKEFENIEISLVIDNKDNISNLLYSNKIDIAFIESKPKSKDFILEKIWTDELVFISSLNHKWSNSKYITYEDLSNNKFIIRENGSGMRETFKNFIESNEIENIDYIELSNLEAIINFVKLGIGVGCVPYISVIEKEKLNILNISRLKDYKLERNLYLAIHKDKYLSLHINRFIDFCRDFSF